MASSSSRRRRSVVVVAACRAVAPPLPLLLPPLLILLLRIFGGGASGAIYPEDPRGAVSYDEWRRRWTVSPSGDAAAAAGGGVGEGGGGGIDDHGDDDDAWRYDEPPIDGHYLTTAADDATYSPAPTTTATTTTSTVVGAVVPSESPSAIPTTTSHRPPDIFDVRSMPYYPPEPSPPHTDFPTWASGADHHHRHPSDDVVVVGCPPPPPPPQQGQRQPFYFDDADMTRDDRGVLYYDSMQANFGVDMGPRGRAVFVNVMLPPRLIRHDDRNDDDDDDDDDGDGAGGGGGGGEEVEAEAEVEVEAEAEAEAEVGEGGAMTGGGGGGETEDDKNDDDGARGGSSRRRRRRRRRRGTETEMPAANDNSTIASGGIANATNTTAAEEDDVVVVVVVGERDNVTLQGGNPQLADDDIADYFCLEDFVNWRIDQRMNSSMLSSSSSSSSTDDDFFVVDVPSDTANATSNLDDVMIDPSAVVPPTTTANNTTSNSTAAAVDSTGANPIVDGMIDSARPLTLLVRRGRCSFESKAKMAMILNDLLANAGRSNRIEHLIVYNNGTDDGRDGEEGKLIDMMHSPTNDDGTASVDEVGDITVGLLYVTTSSGEDLLRRIEEREVSVGVSSYVDVSMLFLEEKSYRDRAGDGNSVDGSTIDDGTQGTIGQDTDSSFHDERISHGWFFPATLTRFCLSCGPPDYGFDACTEDNLFPDGGFLDTGYDHFDQPTIDFEGGPYYDDSLYYSRAWLEVIRKLMVAILVLLLVGPILLAAKRWYTVGGTVRITRDENGTRRVRLVSPNLEVFVNGIPGTVETNGTKLDRAQVFSLPEIEYAPEDEENGKFSDGNLGAVDPGDDERTDNGECAHQDSMGAVPPNPACGAKHSK
ncbi:hypothetical protein ACHAW5_000229 [Stephanodiscus triporus]|uniref:Uncharacterized protein n=1 Tax=Stephanodiscus triporus TaxID=2934178 RepID=A0ABD3QPP5_9STRA